MFLVPESANTPRRTMVIEGMEHRAILYPDGAVKCVGINPDGRCSVPADLPAARQVGVGMCHTCALLEDGSIRCWGEDWAGQSSPPSGLGRAEQLAVGMWHNMALLEDGGLVFWGKILDGEGTPPDALSNIRKIVAGDHFSAALTDTGKVVVWGRLEHRKLGTPESVDAVVDLHAGADHLLALKMDGSLACWGGNVYGQSDMPSGLDHVAQIHASLRGNVVRTTAGETVAWGKRIEFVPWELPQSAGLRFRDRFGACLGPMLNLQLEIATVPDIVATVQGNRHFVGLLRDGTVRCWGPNPFGPCAVPSGLREVTMIAAGGTWSAARTRDGETIVWGADCAGLPWPISDDAALRLLNRDGIALTRDFRLELLERIPTVLSTASGDLHVVALFRSGKVLCYGPADRAECLVPEELQTADAIAAGPGWSAARARDGEVFIWGSGTVQLPWKVAGEQARRLAERSSGLLPTPVLLEMLETVEGVTQLATGDRHIVGLLHEGRVACWGSAEHGQCCPPPNLREIVEVAAGQNWSAAIDAQARKWLWGHDCAALPWPSAILQPGSAFRVRGTPVCVQTDGSLHAPPNSCPDRERRVIRKVRHARAIESSEDHSIALTEHGSVFCWGSNSRGQCRLPEGLNRCDHIACGPEWSAARQTDGLSRVWGYGCEGLPWELDDRQIEALLRDHARSLDPAFVYALTARVPDLMLDSRDSLEHGTLYERSHDARVLRDGRVICFGWNHMHQCDVPEMPPATKVSCGTAHTLALCIDRSIVAWGWNAMGQICPPKALMGRTSDIEAIWHSSWAVDDRGDLHAWGKTKEIDTISLPVTDEAWLRFAASNLRRVKLKLFPDHIRRSREFKAIRAMSKLADP